VKARLSSRAKRHK